MFGQTSQPEIRREGGCAPVRPAGDLIPIPAPPRCGRRGPVGRWLQLFLVLLGFAAPLPAATPILFDLPDGDAAQTLRVFSQQSGEQILYPVEQVRGVRTQPVRGAFTAREALEIMLAATPLSVVQDPASGALVIKRHRAPTGTLPPPAPNSPPTLPGPTAPPAMAPAADEIVVLSPFEVRSQADRGYKAVNTVSATRMAAPISQLPMTVTAFTEAFITDQKAYDLYDIVKWAPGVHQDNISPQGWVRYNIRGFTSAAVQRNGFDSFRFIDTTNIARVEVVKGPASLLYGQINPGGVINYLTKRPEPAPRVQLTANAGDYGYRRGVIDATGPVPGTKGRLLYRLIAMGENIAEFQVLARGTKSMLAPSLTWRISDHSALTIDYEHFARREDLLTGGVVLVYANGIPTIPYPGLPWNFSYAGAGDYQNFISDALTAEFTTQWGEHVNLRATYLDSDWDMEWRASGQGGTGLLAPSFIDAYYPPGAGLTSADAMYRRNRWEHQWGGQRTGQLDLVAHFDLGGVNCQALLGGKGNFDTHTRSLQKNNPNVAASPFYLKPWDLRNPSTWDRQVPFGLDALLLAANSGSSSTGSSLFAVVSATAFDQRLRLLGGFARHALHNDPTRNFFTGTATPATDRAASVPQAGALVELWRGVSAFASYSESFLANASMLRVNNVPAVPAAPSVGKGREAGLKLQLWPDRLSATVSAYRIRASPAGIVTVTSGVDASGTTLFTDVQGGTQLSEGFEADLLFTPAPGCQLMAGFSRCDAVYERHPTTPALDGAPLVATPDRTFSLWGKYTVSHGRWQRVTLAGGLNYVGRMAYVGNNPLVRIGPYTTLDLAIGYRLPVFGRNWDADVSVKNVTDEHYYASASSWGFPRHIIVSLRTEF